MTRNMESFCILPWIHLNTWPNGKVFQCCVTDWRNSIGDLKNESMEDIWNNDYMKQLRLDMLHGKKSISCTKCFEQEENNIRSFRNSANTKFSKHIDDAISDTDTDGYSKNFKLVYWDFRFSNLCNMKCRMCGGHLSSLWHADEKILYGKPSEANAVVNTREESIDNMYALLDEHIDNVEEIYFAGGEPLIMDEHYYILDKLLSRNRTDVKLRYNTNLLKLKYKTHDNIELWDKFDNVQVIASIDAMGRRGEYIRKGTMWSVIESNLKICIEMHHKNDSFDFGIGPTIQIFNVKHLPEFIDYMLELDMPETQIFLNNVLTHPLWYHINTLSNSEKVNVKKILYQHLNQMTDKRLRYFRPQYESIISYMMTESKNAAHVYNQFVRITSELDNIRKDNFHEVFPELHDHWEHAQL